jgi:hypothetical protein
LEGGIKLILREETECYRLWEDYFFADAFPASAFAAASGFVLGIVPAAAVAEIGAQETDEPPRKELYAFTASPAKP